MTETPSSDTLRLADLPSRKPTRFLLVPDETQRAGIARALDLLDLKKLRFEGQLTPLGKTDWRLTGMLGATVVQPCTITLEPVVTRIDEAVERSYLADFEPPEAVEVEMPEDDTTEPLPTVLNLSDVLREALALALPLYPKADGAELGAAQFTEPGKRAMTDDDAKPFAVLAKLRRPTDEGES